MDVDALARQIGAKWSIEGLHAKEQLADEFGHRRGWRQAKHGFTFCQLAYRHNVRRREDDSYPGGHASDHAYFYRELRRPWLPAAIACHIYDWDWPSRQDEVLEVARQFRLGLDVIKDFPSWWFPGRTTLVVFRPEA